MNTVHRITEPLCQWLIGRLERHVGVDDGLSHLRWIARVARPLARKLLAVARTAAYRRTLPTDVFHVASLTATASEGCGHCLAMGSHAALRAGVAPEWVDAAVRGDDAALPAPLREVRHFALAAIRHDDPQLEVCREELRARVGDAGLAELAVAIATARVFPLVRRASGFAGHCPLPAQYTMATKRAA